MKIPVPPHHALTFGRILHNTIHVFLKKRMLGKEITVSEIIKEYKKRCVNEGFLSREHEEMRKKAGEKALRKFYRRELRSRSNPRFIEKNFKWYSGDVKFSGRWDRVDMDRKGAVIIDFKATEVKDQKEADRRTKGSLQMDVYALSYVKTQPAPLLETRLHFLESDVVGRAEKGEREFERALEKIREAEQGIRSQDYEARPDWHNCKICEFRTICPSSYAY
jgi:DNA helicase-2/ATP-dependent DNA helicase PcrA